MSPTTSPSTRHHVAIVLAVAAAGVGGAAAQARTSPILPPMVETDTPPLSTCAPKAATVLKRSNGSKVFRWRGHRYVCVRGARRAFPLGDGEQADAVYRVEAPLALGRRFLAWPMSTQLIQDTSLEIQVLDGRTGRLRREVLLGYRSSSVPGAEIVTGRVSDVVVNDRGQAAAIAPAVIAPANQASPPMLLVLDATDARGARGLGPAVPGSLKLSGKEDLSWRQPDGTRGHATFHP